MSVNDVPLPPWPFPVDHKTEVLKAGSLLHRVHSINYPGEQFVINDKAESRFSPIWCDGLLIPIWYAGVSQACAFYESIFHEAAYLGNNRYISWPKLMPKMYGTWRNTENLIFASFKATALSRLNITIDQLTATDPKYYRVTARWAEAVYRALPHVHGIIWNSYRGNGADTYMLFGHPRTAAVLKPDGHGSVSVIEDAACATLLNECLDETGIDISEHPDSTPTHEITRIPKKFSSGVA